MFFRHRYTTKSHTLKSYIRIVLADAGSITSTMLNYHDSGCLGYQELVFLNGETTKQIRVEIVDDEIPEPDETFEVILSNPKNGLTLGTPSRGRIMLAWYQPLT